MKISVNINTDPVTTPLEYTYEEMIKRDGIYKISSGVNNNNNNNNKSLRIVISPIGLFYWNGTSIYPLLPGWAEYRFIRADNEEINVTFKN